MRRRRTVLSIAAIAVASAGLAIAVPAASAEPAGGASASATLDCHVTDGRYVHCYYGGRYRGMGAFYPATSESLYVVDTAVDHRTVSAHLSWYDNGAKHARVEDTGGSGGVRKDLNIPEGTTVHLWVCLQGIGCGAKYPFRA